MKINFCAAVFERFDAFFFSETTLRGQVSHEDGSMLFSKLKEGRLPRAEEILEALETKLKTDGVDLTAPRGTGRGC